MKKLILLSLFPTLFFTFSFAAVRTANEAALVATQFTNATPSQGGMHKAPMTTNALRLVHQCPKLTVQEPAFYVFNKSDNGGFIIVSGDDRTEDVLAYSEKGTFDAEHINPNLRFWLRHLQEEISAVNDSNKVDKSAPHAASTAIGPLLTNDKGEEIAWYQEEPYNNLCPSDRGGKCLTGCVATAASMVMYHWRYPVKGTGYHSYTNNRKTLSADFENTTYDWNNMLPTYYRKSATSDQETAVATLMYHAGVACDMDYGSDGSGAYTDDMANGLETYFGYSVDKFITTYSSANYSSLYSKSEFSVSMTSFENYFNADLEAGYPIIMGGEDSDGGHEFVCDGRNASGYFHINWGWEGDGNCYCRLSSLKPSGSSYNFSTAIDAIIGLHPAKVDTIHVTSVTIEPSSKKLKINGKVALSAIVQPSDATVQSVSWESSDLSVATVTSTGVVRGVGAGKATITATSMDGNKKDSCKIEVTDEVDVADMFTLVKDASTLAASDEFIIEATFGNAHYCMTSNLTTSTKAGYMDVEQVQIVDDIITLPEQSEIAIFQLSKAASGWFLIFDGDTLGAIDVKKLRRNQGTKTWTIDIASNNATIKNTTETYGRLLYNYNQGSPRFTTYTSATNAALLLPQIYARSTSLPAQVVHVTNVTMGQTTAQLQAGGDFVLYYNVYPADATNQSVLWSSSDPTVAIVDAATSSTVDSKSATIKALAAGKTTITISTVDGNHQATCEVTVTDSIPVPSDTIYVTPSQALVIGRQLSSGALSTDFYGVKGYVTTPNSSDYLGFWLDDDFSTKETFQGYDCKMPSGRMFLQTGDYICLYGYIMNYNNEKYQIKDGSVVLLDTPVPTNLSTEPLKADTNKQIENGQIIFVREGIKYNALGVKL